MTTWRPQLDRNKYRQVILFLLNSQANNPWLGKVKLFKLLYFVDFDHYQEFKTPVAGDIYRKLAYGPVPETAQQILLEMKSAGLIDISKRQVGDYEIHVYTPLALPGAGSFTASEIQVLEQVVAKWANHSTNSIVTATHGEAPWRAVNMGEEIPYALAFYRRQMFGEEADGDEEIYELTSATG